MTEETQKTRKKRRKNKVVLSESQIVGSVVGAASSGGSVNIEIDSGAGDLEGLSMDPKGAQKFLASYPMGSRVCITESRVLTEVECGEE